MKELVEYIAKSIVDAPDETGSPGVFNINVRQGGVPTGGATIMITRGE